MIKKILSYMLLILFIIGAIGGCSKANMPEGTGDGKTTNIKSSATSPGSGSDTQKPGAEDEDGTPGPDDSNTGTNAESDEDEDNDMETDKGKDGDAETDEPGSNQGSDSTGSSSNGNIETSSIDLMASIQPLSRSSDNPRKPEGNVKESISRFSAELFKNAAANPGNVMISPTSVFLALSMTLNGADGDTKAAMLDVLAGKGITLEMLNETSRDLISLFTGTGEKTTLKIANSIWFDQNFLPYKPFLQANADYYSAEARKLDFRNSASKDIINNWVDNATNGLIKEIIDTIPNDVVMYLINAIYFKSDWQIPFQKGNTYNRDFNSPGGVVSTPFMHQTGNMSYFTGHDAAGVALPYDDGKYAFFAILPDNDVSARDWLVKQDNKSLFSNISTMMDQNSKVRMELALPKFESRFENSLKDELTNMGMGIAFEPNKADFSLMNESHARNLFINDVKHKTYIRVDEKGTEAAAVTSVELGVTSIMPDPEIQLILDRPFVYGIMNMETGIPLFAGIMENPAADK